jgi:acyl carrier protein
MMPRERFSNDPIEQRLVQLFSDKLDADVAGRDVDLLDTGVVDSLTIVDLLLYIEQEFRLALPMEELDADDFRSIAAIARCMRSKGRPTQDAAADPAVA